MSIDPRDPVALAQALIRCPSVTPREAGAFGLLEGALAEAGFHVERPVFSGEGTPDVENLYARIGDSGPVLAFAGHVDVVPPGDGALWRHPPFAGEIADGVLYGRGAVDMKGGVAAMVAAVLRHIGAGRPFGAIAFVMTADEEGPGINGTRRLMAWAHERGERFGHCVVGEPTCVEQLGDTVKIGRRGSLTGELTVFGRSGHAAYPERADNPIPRLLRLLAALLEPLDRGSAHFQPSNLEITSVDVGNPTTNVIPGEATARFNVRFNDLHTLDSLERRLRERLTRAAAGGRFELTFRAHPSRSFVTEPGPFVETVATAVADVTGRRPALTTGGGTSDARFIKDYCPVVEFGLVGTTMHATDECVPVADLERLTAVYQRLLERYFGG